MQMNGHHVCLYKEIRKFIAFKYRPKNCKNLPYVQKLIIPNVQAVTAIFYCSTAAYIQVGYLCAVPCVNVRSRPTIDV